MYLGSSAAVDLHLKSLRTVCYPTIHGMYINWRVNHVSFKLYSYQKLLPRVYLFA